MCGTLLPWQKKQSNRADVYSKAMNVLDKLSRAYTPEIYQQKRDLVDQHVFDSYRGEGKNNYRLDWFVTIFCHS